MWNPVRRCAPLGVAVALVLAACTDDAGDGVEEVAEDQAALMELSERLAGSDRHAYTAEYLVEGTGESVIVAVDPEEGDAVVVVEDRPEFWDGEDPDQLASWLSDRLAEVLPAGSDVAEWLAATSGDPSAAAEFSDTTLAGELADCVDVSGAANSPVGVYKVCVTTVGVIASVTAEVDEVAYAAKLVDYHDGVDAEWMDDLASNGKHTDE